MKKYKYKKYDYSFLYNIDTVKFLFNNDWVVKSAKIENGSLIVNVISNGILEKLYIDINNLIGYEEKI
jgi:hypothetical protein